MTRRQSSRQVRSISRRTDADLRREAQERRHAEHRAQVTLYQRAYDAWLDADCRGPRPVHPDRVGAR